MERKLELGQPPKMNWKYVILIFLFAACQRAEKHDQANAIRPNIIFIMADDHAVQAISAYGHKISQLAPTPNIDRLAQNGAIFKNSFCTNSICGPSRAVILTGNHSHVNGFRMNGDHFDNTQATLPKHLQKLGYETAIIGKWHLHGEPTGFDFWNILNDQGNYYNPEFINGKDTTIVEGYATDLVTAKSLDWMNNRTSDKPFFLMVHHKAPHRNWMPALRHANLYDSISFPLPDTYFQDHGQKQASSQQLQTIYKDMYEGHDLKMTRALGESELTHNPWTTDFDRMSVAQRKAWDNAYRDKNDSFHRSNLSGKDLAIWKGQRYLQDYLATVAAVDEGVGQILDYLEDVGLSDNTLIIYTSDQGFYLGEKGWFDKRFMYEESLRMPLLMQWPKTITPKTSIEGMVQNLDFAPTFLDIAGGEVEAYDMQGESFKELLEGSKKGFKDAIYYHYYDYPAFHMVKKQYGIRTHRYKLIHFYDDIDQWEFYDLEKDPNELTNLIDSGEHRDLVNEMHRKLDSLQSHYGVTEKEFETAPKDEVREKYELFQRLRGKPMR